MAVDVIELALASHEVYEQSAMTCVASFREATAAAVPTNAYWMLEDQLSGCEIQAWTSLTPASEISFSVPATLNLMRNETRQYERKVLSVASDYGLSTQLVHSHVYDVKNIASL